LVKFKNFCDLAY